MDNFYSTGSNQEPHAISMYFPPLKPLESVSSDPQLVHPLTPNLDGQIVADPKPLALGLLPNPNHQATDWNKGHIAYGLCSCWAHMRQKDTLGLQKVGCKLMQIMAPAAKGKFKYCKS